MAIYSDLSGNSPHNDSDFRIGGHEDLQAITFRGTTHSITLSNVSQQTAKFSRRCRAVRISPTTGANCHYEIGSNPTAVEATSPFLAAGAVEIVKVRFGDRLAIISDVADPTTLVHIQEDLS